MPGCCKPEAPTIQVLLIIDQVKYMGHVVRKDAIAFKLEKTKVGLRCSHPCYVVVSSRFSEACQLLLQVDLNACQRSMLIVIP